MPRDPFLEQSQDRGGPQMPQLKAGQWLFNRRYQLLRPLGAGGMGVVWLARDHTEETEVALKFLPSVLILQETEMRRLREEVSTGKKLRHSRIVATYALEKEDALAAIVMEYVDGKTLKELLEGLEEQQRTFFEPEEISSWVRDICDALGYLHEEAGRAHRDLKPANIIVGTDAHARLMDFGISHRIHQSLSKFSKTDSQTAATGGSSFTLPYTSPQQLSGRPTNPADDLYSLGATMYEMLTGTPPFFRGDVELIRDQIKNEPPVAMTERRRELVEEGANSDLGQQISPAWESAVNQCLAKKREERPASATALKAALFTQAPAMVKTAEVVQGPVVTQGVEAVAAQTENGTKSPGAAKPPASEAKPRGSAVLPLSSNSLVDPAAIVRRRGYVLMPLVMLTLLWVVVAGLELVEFSGVVLPAWILFLLSGVGAGGLLRGAKIWHWTCIAAVVVGALLSDGIISYFLTPGNLTRNMSWMKWVILLPSLGLLAGIVYGWRQAPVPSRVIQKSGLVLVPIMIWCALHVMLLAWRIGGMGIERNLIPAAMFVTVGVVGSLRFFNRSEMWSGISVAFIVVGAVLGTLSHFYSEWGCKEYDPGLKWTASLLSTGLLVWIAFGWKQLPAGQQEKIDDIRPAAESRPGGPAVPPLSPADAAGIVRRRGYVLMPLMMLAALMIIWMPLGLGLIEREIGYIAIPSYILFVLGLVGGCGLLRGARIWNWASIAAVFAGAVMFTLCIVVSKYRYSPVPPLTHELFQWTTLVLSIGLLAGAGYGFRQAPEPHLVIHKRGLALAPLMLNFSLTAVVLAWLEVRSVVMPSIMLMLVGVIGVIRFRPRSRTWSWISAACLLVGSLMEYLVSEYGQLSYEERQADAGPIVTTSLLSAVLFVFILFSLRYLPAERQNTDE